MDPDLGQRIEHTLLAADSTPEGVETLCREAVQHGLLAVCVAPVYVAFARDCLRGTPVRVVTVVAFPFGYAAPRVKAEEARRAVEDGADEIDMVAALGLASGGGFHAVEADVRAVRDVIPGRVLKVILETGYFEPDEVTRLAEAAIRGGADFLKTSTGFGPRGATVDDVRLLVEVAAGRAEVKASGGIRTREAALEMIAAGATRIGTSHGAKIADG